MFDPVKVKNECVNWIRGFFAHCGKGCNAVIGISGGKDSSIAAALCVEALGKERVIGVLMPNGEQADIDCALQLVKHLDIPYHVININDAVDGVLKHMPDSFELSEQTKVNLAPRIRMATLYAVSQSNNGRVVNTSNLSEDWVGYSTRYGDGAGDFSPMANLTVTELKEIGYVLHLPKNLVDKTPVDGLCGKSDEENLGFRYDTLDKYIRTGVCESAEVKELIDKKHEANKFKLEPMPCFKYSESI